MNINIENLILSNYTNTMNISNNKILSKDDKSEIFFNYIETCKSDATYLNFNNNQTYLTRKNLDKIPYTQSNNNGKSYVIGSRNSNPYFYY